MRKINSVYFGGKLLGLGVALTVLVPLILKLMIDTFSWWFLLPVKQARRKL